MFIKEIYTKLLLLYYRYFYNQYHFFFHIHQRIKLKLFYFVFLCSCHSWVSFSGFAESFNEVYNPVTGEIILYVLVAVHLGDGTRIILAMIYHLVIGLFQFLSALPLACGGGLEFQGGIFHAGFPWDQAVKTDR